MPKPLTALSYEQVQKIQWLLTDVDDTLTWEGQLPPEALEALNTLKNAGIYVVAVTGACAGWCDQIAKLWPVHGVIGENGAFWMQKNSTGFHSHFLTPIEKMKNQQQALIQQIRQVLDRYPNIEFANDQNFRYCDVAINLGQYRKPVSNEIATQLLNEIRQLKIDGHPVKATQSSIHINAWIGEHSKRHSSELYLQQHADFSNLSLSNISYIGDSLNDESMFEWLPITFGVNNISPILNKLSPPPTFITQSVGGYGFAELANIIKTAKIRK